MTFSVLPYLRTKDLTLGWINFIIFETELTKFEKEKTNVLGLVWFKFNGIISIK